FLCTVVAILLALFLHVHLCLDVCGGPSHIPHTDRAAQHKLRRHEVLLRHRLGVPPIITG
ncbi:unnamed protein product, partial [Tetraodon nigroviridis]